VAPLEGFRSGGSVQAGPISGFPTASPLGGFPSGWPTQVVTSSGSPPRVPIKWVPSRLSLQRVHSRGFRGALYSGDNREDPLRASQSGAAHFFLSVWSTQAVPFKVSFQSGHLGLPLTVVSSGWSKQSCCTGRSIQWAHPAWSTQWVPLCRVPSGISNQGSTHGGPFNGFSSRGLVKCVPSRGSPQLVT
jgi:hypothetical protein